MTTNVRDIEPQDAEWMREFLLAHAHATRMVTRAVMHQVDQLPGIVGIYDGEPAALLTYHVASDEFEVVTLHAAISGVGLGSALLEAACERAQARGCRRLWLITTNDNEPVIRFYERRGMTLVAIHHDAIAESRKLKPEIPLTGIGGRPIRDEIEFEFGPEVLAQCAAVSGIRGGAKA